jgi:ribosomal protein S18 acetylase RimI-like enzyme
MLTLRKAKEDDVSFLVELRLSTMDEHMINAGLVLSVDEHKERVLYQYERFHLVLDNKSVIGAVKFEDTDSCLYIHQIQVKPTQQGKGYGRQIIGQLIQGTVHDTVELKVLKQNPALRLYTAIGFEVIGEDEFEYHLRKVTC